MDEEQKQILREHGISEVEKEACLCLYYDIPASFEEMPSDILGEIEGAWGKGYVHRYQVDDFRVALESLRRKEWICVYEEGMEPFSSAVSEGIPSSPFLDKPWPGQVLFTTFGYEQYWSIQSRLWGDDRQDSYESFWSIDRGDRIAKCYARTEEAVAHMLLMAQQV